MYFSIVKPFGERHLSELHINLSSYLTENTFDLSWKDQSLHVFKGNVGNEL